MEQLKRKLDDGSFSKLTGIPCCVNGCPEIVAVENIKHHLSTAHNVKTSRKSVIPLRCPLCGSLYNYYVSLKKHLLTHNLRNSPEDLSEESDEGEDEGPPEPFVRVPSPTPEDDPMPLNPGIENPVFFQEDVSLEEITSKFMEVITELRSDVSLPEKKVQQFLSGFSSIILWSQRHAMSQVKQFLGQENYSFDDESSIKLINSMFIPDVTKNVLTFKDNLNFLISKANCPVPEPVETILGQTKLKRCSLLGRSKGKKFQRRVRSSNSVAAVKVQKDVLHYIPILDTLRLIMGNPEARTMVEAEEPSRDGSIVSYKDTTLFAQHPFLTSHPHALRLSLHVDDVEYVNPLGSRKGKNKLTVFSFKIQNFDSRVNSSLDRVYLALMVKSSVLKKYGYPVVLNGLIKDLLVLESTQGIDVRTSIGPWNLRAVLVNVLGDTLAIHEIYGLLGPSANRFCRTCYISRRDLKSGELGDSFTHRTAENVQEDLLAIANHQKTPKECGVRSDCALHELRFFRWANAVCYDPMHDLLEGIFPMIIKLILKHAVQSKIITEQSINHLIDTFDYGECEDSAKPASNFSHQILNSKTNSLSQSASQTWLLMRAFPFIFDQVLQQKPIFGELVSSLLMISFVCFSHKLTQAMVNDLNNAIEAFHILFKECFSSSIAINKVHHLAHYGQSCVENGPLYNASCLLFEAKFKESKSQGKTCGNFKNLTFSLTKRLAFKQINSIMKQSYVIDNPVIIASTTLDKTTIDSSGLLLYLPQQINVIQHLQINRTDFRPGYVVKYLKHNGSHYGIILLMVNDDNQVITVIQELNIVQFDLTLFAFKVTLSQNLIRVTRDKLLSRKCYNLWKIKNDDIHYYISLKYYDD